MKYLLIKQKKNINKFKKNYMKWIIFKFIKKHNINQNKKLIIMSKHILNSLKFKNLIKKRCLITSKSRFIYKKYNLSRFMLKSNITSIKLFNVHKSSF